MSHQVVGTPTSSAQVVITDDKASHVKNPFDELSICLRDLHPQMRSAMLLED